MSHRPHQVAVLLSVGVGIPDFAEPPRRIVRLAGTARQACAVGAEALVNTPVHDPRPGDRSGAEEGGIAPGGHAGRLPRWFRAALLARRHW